MLRYFPIIALLVVSACNDGPEQTGYFKADAKHRVMAYLTKENMSDEEARSFLLKAPHTDGRVTMAILYTFPTVAPGSDLTMAKTLPEALQLVGESYPGWAMRLRRNPAGQITFDSAND